MNRIALWALSTLTVLVLLFGYHTSLSGPTSASAPPVAFSGSIAGAAHTTTPRTTTSGANGATTTPAAARTVSGDTADTRWGPVQVAGSVTDGTITEVQVLQYPTGSSQDEEINQYALPVLIQETLDAQSAAIDMVSGATVTSVGYQQSLQSALDQAGL